MSLGASLGLISTSLLWMIALRITSRRFFDAAFISLSIAGYHFVGRSTLIVSGWDSLFPDDLFADGTAQESVEAALFLSSAFFFAWVMGALLGRRLAVLRSLPFSPDTASTNRLEVAVLSLTAVAVVISGYLIVRFGSVAGVVEAVKRDGELAGFFILRQAPAIAAVFGATLAVDESRSRSARTLGLIAVVLNGAMALLWGTRIPFALAGLILATAAAAGRSRGRTRRGQARSLAVLPLVIMLIFGLRVGRDLVTRGDVSNAIEGRTAARQLSVATNGTQFDAFVLATRDFDRVHPFRYGDDFMVGAVGWIPRSLWSAKPDGVAPGNAFRRLYEPEKDNGWPLTSAGEWYINFGTWGVAVGGFLGGLVLAAVANARKHLTGYLNHSIDVVIGVVVFQMGLWTQAPVRIVLWLVPLGLVLRLVKGRSFGIDPMTSSETELPGLVDA